MMCKVCKSKPLARGFRTFKCFKCGRQGTNYMNGINICFNCSDESHICSICGRGALAVSDFDYTNLRYKDDSRVFNSQEVYMSHDYIAIYFPLGVHMVIKDRYTNEERKCGYSIAKMPLIIPNTSLNQDDVQALLNSERYQIIDNPKYAIDR